MEHEDLTLSDVLRLIKAIEQSSTNPDVIRAIVNRVPAEPVENGRVTIGSMLRLLKQTNGCTVLPEEIAAQLNAPEPITVESVITQRFTINPYLRLISDQPLMIGSTDGKRIIADAADVFGAGIVEDFRKWGANESGDATRETPILVYEMVQNATLAQMFSSLSSDLDKLRLTQAQIIEFVKTHRNQLRTDGWCNFFLFKSNGEVFVANLDVFGGGSIIAGICRFNDAGVWHAEHQNRVFVPQLA